MKKPVVTKSCPTGIAGWLAARLNLAADEMPQPGAWSESGNTIGALALRLNALSLEQIDEIIELQVTSQEAFGEVAVRLGFLTRDQLDHLLELQQFHRDLELGELLVMQGRVDLATCVEILADYLGRRRGVPE